MEKYAGYNRVLGGSKIVALATSVENVPNVRLLSFIFDDEKQGVIYFATDNSSRKVEEFWENNRVAVTTIPTDGVSHIRSTDCTVAKSALTIQDLGAKFIAAFPGYDMIIETMSDVLEVFEVKMKNCVVVTGMDKFETVTF
jgi:uncharacterized pyridoxamine 5'-phosphate oxidase family protein